MRLFLWVLPWCVATCVIAEAGKQVFSGPVVPDDPAGAGKELAARLLSLRPAEGVTNTVALTNLVKNKFQFAVPLRIEVSVSESNWTTSYVQVGAAGNAEKCFVVVRHLNGPSDYYVETVTNGVTARAVFQGQDAAVPVAGSDFTLSDVGMEFLRWPAQRLLVKEVFHSQSCDKLESVAPEGWTNGYVRVVSWFDIDTGAPVLIEAYDTKGKVVKEFKPSEVRKVDGQWRVEELEMNNWRTGSRSTLRFLYDKR